MRISALSIGLLAVLTPLTSAWTKEDREIFRVRDEIATHEGADVTFYDFIGVSPTANQDDINKAYRKKSRSLHPDKVKSQLQAERLKKQKEADKKKKEKGGKPGSTVIKPPSASELRNAVKAASDRQARLSLVANILRGAGRERYDHFLSHGFPVWKGTGYYYNRYRPGLGTVMVGLFLFAGGAAHYLALYMGWRRQREFVERYIRYARDKAWGDNLGVNIPGVDAQPVAVPAPPPPAAADDGEGPPMPMNRKQRRMQERESKKEAAKESGGRRGRKGAAAAAPSSGPASGAATPLPVSQGSGPTGAKKRVVAENGKVLVVDSLGDVYLEQEDEEGNVQEFLLDPNEIPAPTFTDTAVVRLPIWVYTLTVGRLLNRKTDDAEEDEEEEAAEDDEDSEPGKRTPSTDSNEDFEMLEKSTDSLGAAKASGSQKQRSKASKRKGRK